MFLNSVYFRIKPLIPRALRLSIRRALALRKLKHVRDVWPIIPGSERPPQGWQGWPEGKQFAFVLSHDVESQRGLDRVKQLAELEMQCGFRSSFNFIPEGPYSVPPALRSWLVDHGFEVGIHDLHHDGLLFSSREEFDRKAHRINKVLKQWNAVGFRSAYMLRNLDWIHKLDISYDSSTFDTDPFEPQPDGVNTIFPFWVPAPAIDESPTSDVRLPTSDCPLHAPTSPSAFPNFGVSAFGSRPGYLELPYTLPQDSTLFLLLGETTPDIWLKKLDWIAAHGGMALVIVHPDYVRFEGEPTDKRTFSVLLYETLLRSAQANYADLMWTTSPTKIATYCRKKVSNVTTEHEDILCIDGIGTTAQVASL